MLPTATAHVRLHSTTERSTASHRTHLVHTGPVRTELCKLTGSPDASHQTHPKRSVLPGLMRREGRQTARTPDAEHRTHSGAPCALYTPAPQTNTTPDPLDQRPVLPTPASGDFSKFPTGVIENIHLIFSKAPNPAERGTQTPLYPRNFTSFAKVPTPPSVHHHMQVC